MKLLITIWTAYLLVLTSIPCSDVYSQNFLDNTNIENHQTQTESHNHNKDLEDSCNPFCYCSCCRVNVDSFEVLSFEFSPIRIHFNTKPIIIPNFNIISHYPETIWHPPKYAI